MGAVAFRRVLERIEQAPDAAHIAYRALLPVAVVARESHAIRSKSVAVDYVAVQPKNSQLLSP